MSKGIDVSLDEIIQKSRKQQGNFGYKKYVNPKLKEYGDQTYQRSYNNYDRNRLNIKKKKIVFARRNYHNDSTFKNNDVYYEKKTDPRYTDKEVYEEHKNYERDKKSYEDTQSQRRKFPERRKTSETEKSYSPDVQRSRTRLKISNLHSSITNSDLFQLFSDIGELKRCGIHWDILGKSLGTADIEYVDPEHAKKAMEEFNNAEFEGLEIKIEYAETRNKVDLNERIKRIRLKGKDNNSNRK